MIDGLVEIVAGAVRCDLQNLAVGIREVDAREPAAIVRTRYRYTRIHQATLPFQLGGLGLDAERDMMRAADTPVAAQGGWANDERENVGEHELIRMVRCVEAEKFFVEADGALRIARNHSNVVKTGCDYAGSPAAWNPSSFIMRTRSRCSACVSAEIVSVIMSACSGKMRSMSSRPSVVSSA